MQSALDDFGMDKITDVINKIYNSGDVSKLIFVAVPKKPDTNECELKWKISLMSHITKTMMRILMNRNEAELDWK